MTHWKKLTNPNYLGVYALEDGKSLVLTIKSVGEEMVQNPEGKEECVVVHFLENVKPMILNKTNLKTLEKLFKTPYIEQWTGHKIEVASEKVKAFGEVVDALRIKKQLPTCAAPVKCSECGRDIAPIGSMDSAAVARYTTSKYGRALCGECATKAAKEQEMKQEDSHENNENSD
ncbi:MAG: hypothetical protein ACI4FZ_02655 [Lachnospiraceae bacterium]